MPMTVTVPAERMGKILDVVSVLSLGNVEPERTQIAVKDDDELALLEHTLNDLGAELAEMRVESQQARETIEAQRRAIRALAAPIVELIKRLGLEVVQKPAGGRRTELELIVDELVSGGRGV